MNRKWWEPVMGFICDNWWVLVLLLALFLAVVFTRDLWIPLLFS
jgi:hypothetical protein